MEVVHFLDDLVEMPLDSSFEDSNRLLSKPLLLPDICLLNILKSYFGKAFSCLNL